MNSELRTLNFERGVLAFFKVQGSRFLVFPLLLCAALASGSALGWDHADYYEGLWLTRGYRVMVGTNSRVYGVTNDVGLTNTAWLPRLRLFPVLTNYFAVTAYDSNGRETSWSDEVYYWRTNLYVRLPVTNVTLRVPSGKFYVERANSPSAWLAMNVVTGPTNMVFPTTGPMGFYRARPYFVAAVKPKAGQLTPAKAVMFKPAKKKPVTVGVPIDLRGINLDPSKATR